MEKKNTAGADGISDEEVQKMIYEISALILSEKISEIKREQNRYNLEYMLIFDDNKIIACRFYENNDTYGLYDGGKYWYINPTFKKIYDALKEYHDDLGAISE